MTKTDSRKKSFYIPQTMLEDLNAQALRLDRSFSWLIQQAWLLSRDQIANYQGMSAPTPRQMPLSFEDSNG